MKGTTFWDKLKKPIMVLAPMANVTDASFRKVIAKYGKPDVMWTEFVSADGLMRATKTGKEKLMRDLLYSEEERPIVAQFFGSNVDTMYEAGRLAVRLGFDGADINMGCPDKAIMKQKAGASLIRTPMLAKELIHALRKGVEDEAKEKKVPMIAISVKTRIGYSTPEVKEWIGALLEEDLDALIIHARTMKELSKVPARWEFVKEAVELRNIIQEGREKKTLILGNGDALDLADAQKKVEETGADGVMLGRAIFGNPWLWGKRIPSKEEKMEVLIEHSELFEKLLGDIKNFAIMKKHYKAYVNGFDGAKELRVKLMEAKDLEEVKTMIKNEQV